MLGQAFLVFFVHATLVTLCHGEVVDEHFSKCQSFFYKNKPPEGLDDIDGSAYICQTLGNTVFYATHFSKTYRIPIYSAYRIDSFDCSPNQPKRRNTWFNEPQLYRANLQKSMDLAGALTSVFQDSQAINKDYPNTNYDRGHLNPNFYQCDSGREATFTMTNCVPQDPCFNQQSWKQMEEAARTFMRSSCNFPGSERYFVTGAIPTTNRIPNRWHDTEGDVNREYNRVSIPSGMWTAVCCDSSKATHQSDRDKGFSFAYYGDNEPDSWVRSSTVAQLQAKIERLYRVHSVDIFADSCLENSDNSKKALQYMNVPVERKAADVLNSLGHSSQSSMPPAKRKYVHTVDNILQQSTSVTMQDWRVDDVLYGIVTHRDENQAVREALKNNGLSTLLTVSLGAFDKDKSEHPEAGKKHKYSDERETKNYEVSGRINQPDRIGYENTNDQPDALDEAGNVQEMEMHLDSTSNDEDKLISETDTVLESSPIDKYDIVSSSEEWLSAKGDRCRLGHRCGTYGRSYKWCYIDWNNNWDYCCTGRCDFHKGTSYQYCDTGNTWTYCSQRSSMLTVSGKPCRPDHECATHGKNYYWCYTDIKQNWDYCCQPWHDCLKYGYSYKWCYVGYQKKSNSQKCYY